jgi:hypothetical protein
LLLKELEPQIYQLSIHFSESAPGFENAIKACWNAIQLFNGVLTEEIRRFTKFFPHFDHASRAADQKIGYPFLWYNACANVAHSQYYVPLLLQFTHCVISEPLPVGQLDENSASLWSCYCCLLSFFFQCSFADQFTSPLVSNQDFPGLVSAFEVLLQVSHPQ